MSDSAWFEGIPSVGELDLYDRREYLQDVGDPSLDEEPEHGGFDVGTETAVLEAAFFGIGEKKPFDHTGSQTGYIMQSDDGLAQIADTRVLTPEGTLAGQRVTISLTQALVVRYPGRGQHQILFHLDAGERKGGGERFQFSSTLRVADGNTPAAIGQILFSGLTVGAQGLSVRLKTVNVRSEGDEELLAVLQNDVLQHGLDLAASLGPAVALLSAALGSVAQWMAGRAKNRPVQDGLLALGLDADAVDTPKLRAGTYVLVQAPATIEGNVWSWDNYRYDPARGAIVETQAPERAIGFNYIALAITRFPG